MRSVRIAVELTRESVVQASVIKIGRNGREVVFLVRVQKDVLVHYAVKRSLCCWYKSYFHNTVELDDISFHTFCEHHFSGDYCKKKYDRNIYTMTILTQLGDNPQSNRYVVLSLIGLGLWAKFPSPPPILQDLFDVWYMKWLATALLYMEGIGFDMDVNIVLRDMLILFLIHHVLTTLKPVPSSNITHEGKVPTKKR